MQLWPRERPIETEPYYTLWTELGLMYLPRKPNGAAEDCGSCVSL